jgi:ABC-type multidrug transport system ATPase subunit
MSETVIEALVRLFALISDSHDETVITSREKDVVKSFLSRQLGFELVKRYMDLFEEYLEFYNSEHLEKGTLRERKHVSLNAMKILDICEKINKELQQRQKIYILVQLIDFVSFGEKITENELDFINTVAYAFNIPVAEYEAIRDFIINDLHDVKDKKKLLLISSIRGSETDDIKHVYDENLSGNIAFLHIPSTNTYILRYKGDDDLYLNGQNIFSGQTCIFDHGSVLRGTGLRPIYYSEISSMVSEVTYKFKISLDARDVSFKFRNSSNGIHNLNFHGEEGKLIGILGGSGVGKSTTLSILNGTLKPQYGTVLINGYSLYDDIEKKSLNGVIGFVPQDDLLIEELTVYQNVYFNAKLCLNNLSESKLTEVVNKILIDFDLEEISDLKVGNPLKKIISGGQRKRVNIALELLREPNILFVDEPTSGLSSVDSEIVMNLLKEQTHKGKLVIINIHQPSSDIYKMFDKIMIIDKGGYQIYFGNPTEAIVWFKTMTNHANPREDQCVKCGNVNPDQILQIIEAKVVDEHGRATRTRRVTSGEWAEKFNKKASAEIQKEIGGKQKLPANNFSTPGLFKQSGIFFMRDILSKLANRQYILISLLGPPVLAFFLGYFTRSSTGNTYMFSENDNIPAYLFMCIITSLFFGLMLSSEEIVKDRKILKREAFLNLSWFSYLNAKIMTMFLLSAIQSISFVLIGNAILEINGMTLSYWFVLFTTSCFANMLGLNISSAFSSVILIYIIIPFIIIPQLLFSGVLVKFDKLHICSYSAHEYVPVIGDLMTARWSFEALAVKQFKDNDYERNFFRYNMNESQNYYYSSFLVDQLNIELRICDIYRDSADYRKNVSDGFKRLNYHIGELSEISKIETGKWKDSLSIERFSSGVEKRTAGYLDLLKNHFSELKKKAVSDKDALYNSLENQIGKNKLLAIRNESENKQLVKLVLDIENIDKTYLLPGKIVQKLDPGYMKPTSRWGRAHFYAPYKQIFNLTAGTYWFNILVIWIEALLLYFALYKNIFRRLISYFENFHFQKPEI